MLIERLKHFLIGLAPTFQHHAQPLAQYLSFLFIERDARLVHHERRASENHAEYFRGKRTEFDARRALFTRPS